MEAKQSIATIGLPEKQGLYDPKFEKDNCGIGFIANIKGEKSHEIVEKGLLILKNLSHRGATGCDETTGDGAGIMIQIPHEFFKKKCKENKIYLPDEGQYAVGMVFLPRESDEDLECEGIFETILREEGLKLLGWRDVEVDRNAIGEIAKGSEPLIKQVFIDKEDYTTEEFERKLFIVRKKAEIAIRNSNMHNKGYFYIPSLSSRTIIYKGLLLARQIGSFYKDLEDKDFKSALALIHQRYSTNTFPTWDLAQPFRYLAHNGEINTIMGNRNWMNVREGVLKSDKFKDGLEELFPILTPNCSDSATLDNAFELLISTGKSLTEAMTMLIPQAWNGNELMDEKEKAYYNYHATIMEPWDGPAAIAFTNGVQLGAMLDRNGLRPSRYTITKDGFVILASETGVLETEPSNVEYSGRLEPGKIFMLDLEQGRIIPDEEVKKELFEAYDYEGWIQRNKITMDMIAKPSYLPKGDEDTLLQRQQAFGYTYEDIKMVLAQMARDGKEPQGSMGDDTPLAVLSKKPQLLYNYFKQLFAQVTNPPIDPIREESIMSLVTIIGQKANLLDNDKKDYKFIQLDSPILSDVDLEKISKINSQNLRAVKIPMLFRSPGTGEDLVEALDLLCQRAKDAILEGYNVIILSDRNINKQQAPIPALLATSALQHYLINNKLRTNVNIILETGEAKEVMHFALLIGYGATAINPYLAYETIDQLAKKELYVGHKSAEQLKENYNEAVCHGLLKIISKMGISTIQSYRSAQIFECIGINSDVVEKYFTGTPTRIEGIGLDIIAKETLARHNIAYNKLRNPIDTLELGGKYNYIRNEERHMFNPYTITTLQKVNGKIGQVRHAIPGIDLISPPPHHDIYSIEDLEQLIHDLKSVNPEANISVKLVSEVGVGTVAAGVAKAKADLILISGYDGGTGAAPYTSIRYTGGPWELGLSEAHQVLLMNNLRSRVKLQTDGQMRTGKDVVVAALLGAEEFGFATTPLVVMGCMMMRKCHSNTCPMGVATQNPELRKKFKGKVEHVINYFTFVANEVREIMAQLGFRTMDEMIGRVDKLEINELLRNEKTKDLDFSSILYRPNLPQRIVGRKIMEQDHGIDTAYDLKLIEFAKPSLENKTKVTGDFKIKNINRTVGTMLSGEIAKRYGAEGLPDDKITLNLTGSTGQSFMAFGMKGITINLTGDCNDYVGKGLSGAKIKVKLSKECTVKSDENIIVGNTVLYGATSGEFYANGKAGERFAVRNSGATAVVEGVGDHGCEYMTGGTVVILGDIGRNFAAGMSGGKVFVYDPQKQLGIKINHGVINSSDIESLIDTKDEARLKDLIEKHYEYTDSKKSKAILDNWDKEKLNIVRVIPKMYKKLISEYKAV